MSDIDNVFTAHGPYQRRLVSLDGKTVVLQEGQGGDAPGGWFLVPTTEYRRFVEALAWYRTVNAQVRAAVKEADPR